MQDMLTKRIKVCSADRKIKSMGRQHDMYKTINVSFSPTSTD
jgi:hypothetical protein